MPVHQIFTMHTGVIRQTELPERQLEMRFLGLMRVQADGYQNEVAQIFGTLAKKRMLSFQAV